MNNLLHWDIYEITTNSTPINGVMFRGRIRKFCLEHGINVLVENTEDIHGGVRFCILSGEDASEIQNYVKVIAADAEIVLVLRAVANPVLSKLQVNNEERYTL